VWWQILFWFLLVPTLIILGVVYGTSKRLYKLFYILASFTYVIFIAYLIDVFSLGKNWILGLLVFSAVLMLLLGYRLATKRGKVRTRRAKQDRRCWFLLALILVLMLVLVILGSLARVMRTPHLVVSLPRQEVAATTMGGGVSLGTMTYENSFFLPATIPDRAVTACWYNTTAERSGPEIEAHFGKRSARDALAEVAPGSSLTRHLILGFEGAPPPKGELNQTLPQYEAYDAILVVSGPERLSCDDPDASFRKVIPLTD